MPDRIKFFVSGEAIKNCLYVFSVFVNILLYVTRF